MNRWKRCSSLLAALLITVTLVGWWLWSTRRDPQLLAIAQLQSQMKADLPPEQRRELWTQMQTKLEQLPSEKREQARTALREEFRATGRKRMDEFFALPKDKQIEHLDRDIASMQRRRQAAASRPQTKNTKSQTGNRNRWQNASSEQRSQWRKERLNNTDPKERAQWHAYRDMIRERMQQQGIAFGGPRRGGN